MINGTLENTLEKTNFHHVTERWNVGKPLYMPFPSSNVAKQNFVIYIRTKMFMRQQLRNEDVMNHVYISMKEIQERFFKDAKNDIKHLVDIGEMDVIKKVTSKGYEAFYYKALKSGSINFSLLLPHGRELDSITKPMMQYLKDVSLSINAPSTLYFNAFLQCQNNLRIFFTVDKFSGRVHTPISNFHRTHRPNILLQGEKTYSLDVTTMQPLLLGKILKQKIGENEYSAWINSGEDIYIMLQNKAKLSTRDEAKKRFFEILFSRANDKLAEMFGSANWINWINEYKRQPEKSNPHTVEKQYSNMAWLLQNTEVEVMRKVWVKLLENYIPFLSVHDEIIIKHSDKVQAEQIFRNVLDAEFEYYKLNSKTIAEPEQATKDQEFKILESVANTNFQPHQAPEKIIGQAFWNKKPTEPINFDADILKYFNGFDDYLIKVKQGLYPIKNVFNEFVRITGSKLSINEFSCKIQ